MIWIGPMIYKACVLQINTQTAFADDPCIPQIFKMQYLHLYK